MCAALVIDGFYAVIDRDDEALATVLAAHACVLQVRMKNAGAAELARVARMARRVCDRAGIALVVNDRIDVALAVGADGVHLGQTDLPLADARAIAGGIAIGISTHDLAQVNAACAGGADYLGFGPVFATRTKENPDPVQGLSGLAAAVRAATVPVVAIGGITAAHAAEVYATGVAGLCAISAVTSVAEANAMRRSSGSSVDRVPSR